MPKILVVQRPNAFDKANSEKIFTLMPDNATSRANLDNENAVLETNSPHRTIYKSLDEAEASKLFLAWEEKYKNARQNNDNEIAEAIAMASHEAEANRASNMDKLKGDIKAKLEKEFEDKLKAMAAEFQAKFDLLEKQAIKASEKKEAKSTEKK